MHFNHSFSLYHLGSNLYYDFIILYFYLFCNCYEVSSRISLEGKNLSARYHLRILKCGMSFDMLFESDSSLEDYEGPLEPINPSARMLKTLALKPWWQWNPYSIKSLRRVNIGRIVLNYYKNLEFIFSLSYYILYIMVFQCIYYIIAYICHLNSFSLNL